MKVSLGKMPLWSLEAAVHLAKDESLKFMIEQGWGVVGTRDRESKGTSIRWAKKPEH